MTEHDSYLRIDTSRGGCLDSLVMVISLWQLGVETTIKYPRPIHPTGIRIGKSGGKYAIDNGVISQMLDSGEPVVINDFKAANTPKVSRRIVRNK